MTVVEQYWSGVLKRLQAEVDSFNNLIQHSGEQGRENELSLARLLTNFLPRRYSVGSGLLIDSNDDSSKQMDIVVFDQSDAPALLAQTTQVLFPIEDVRACIEVKTTIAKSEVEDAGEKFSSILRLQSTLAADTPVFGLLGYGADSHARTVAKNIRGLKAEGLDHRPDIFCVVNLGLIGVRSDLVDWWEKPPGDPGSDYIIGIACRHEMDNTGNRIAGKFRKPSDGSDTDYFEGGSIYPIVKSADGYYVGEPSRALLMFCEVLVCEMAKRAGQTKPTMLSYVTPTARELVFL